MYSKSKKATLLRIDNEGLKEYNPESGKIVKEISNISHLEYFSLLAIETLEGAKDRIKNV